jgi:YD repeat-containing protein
MRRAVFVSTCFQALLLLTVMCPRDAFAAFGDVCEPYPYKGRVKLILYAEGAVDQHTGALLQPATLRRTINVSKDGRVVTEIESDGSNPVLDARTVREYDADGRLLHEALMFDEATPYTETRCEYDAQGRLARATMTSQNPDYNGEYTYTYTATSRSERYVNGAASYFTTVTLDEQGRAVREVEERSLPQQQRVSVFRYGENGTERCWHVHTDQRRCLLTRHDAHGNAVEMRSDEGTATTEFEYDGAGNWVKGTIRGYVAPVVWRRFSYWDQ